MYLITLVALVFFVMLFAIVPVVIALVVNKGKETRNLKKKLKRLEIERKIKFFEDMNNRD